MNRLSLTVSVAVFASFVLLHPARAHGQVAVAPAFERLPHISVTVSGASGLPPVMLIPGLASPRAVWDGVLPALERTHRVYLVQVNGFGGDAPDENTTPGVLDGIAADLDRDVRTHNIERPAIIGHSMGGLLAMMMGARYPQSTGSILVVDALPFFSLLYGPMVTAESAKPFAERARAQALAMPPAIGPVTSDPGGIWSNTAAGRVTVANWSAKADPRVVAQSMYELMTTDLRTELSQVIARPFTVLYATGAGPQAKVIWEGGYAGSAAQLVPIADSWHFIMLDQPAAFAKALTEFLAAR